jgi:oligosaccharide repeat unit polymerase
MESGNRQLYNSVRKMKEIRISSLWWLQPSWMFLLAVAGTLFLAYTQDEHDYLMYGTQKYLDFEFLTIGLSGVAAFLFGCWFANGTVGSNPQSVFENARGAKLVFITTSMLTFFGYAIWFLVGLKHGFSVTLLPQILAGGDTHVVELIREQYFQTIPGVTTCTQFGPAAAIIGAWLYRYGDHKVVWILVAILSLAFTRAVLLGERLAIIELVVPLGILTAGKFIIDRPLSPLFAALTHAVPIVGLCVLLVFFGVSESLRSWKYYKNDFDSIGEFTIWRVAGYYTTAHNNGALISKFETSRPMLPYVMLQALWNIPGVDASPFSYKELTGVDIEENYFSLLEKYGTPELNNRGGLFQPLIELGIAGSLVFWACCGFVSQRCYQSFSKNRRAGLLFYPMLALSILEVPRILYLADQRATPSIVALIAAYWLMGTSRCMHQPDSNLSS